MPMARIRSLRGKRSFAMKPSISIEAAGCGAPCTSRTSTPITAALKTGCTISTGWRRNIWRITLVGDGQSTCGASTRPKASSERRWGFSTANGESANNKGRLGALLNSDTVTCCGIIKFSTASNSSDEIHSLAPFYPQPPQPARLYPDRLRHCVCAARPSCLDHPRADLLECRGLDFHDYHDAPRPHLGPETGQRKSRAGRRERGGGAERTRDRLHVQPDGHLFRAEPADRRQGHGTGRPLRFDGGYLDRFLAAGGHPVLLSLRPQILPLRRGAQAPAISRRGCRAQLLGLHVFFLHHQRGRADFRRASDRRRHAPPGAGPLRAQFLFQSGGAGPVDQYRGRLDQIAGQALCANQRAVTNSVPGGDRCKIKSCARCSRPRQGGRPGTPRPWLGRSVNNNQSARSLLCKSTSTPTKPSNAIAAWTNTSRPSSSPPSPASASRFPASKSTSATTSARNRPTATTAACSKRASPITSPSPSPNTRPPCTRPSAAPPTSSSAPSTAHWAACMTSSCTRPQH